MCFSTIKPDTLIKRINRKIALTGLQLKVARGAKQIAELGTYYVINIKRNKVTSRNVDLIAQGLSHGVIEAGMQLEEKALAATAGI